MMDAALTTQTTHAPLLLGAGEHRRLESLLQHRRLECLRASVCLHNHIQAALAGSRPLLHHGIGVAPGRQRQPGRLECRCRLCGQQVYQVKQAALCEAQYPWQRVQSLLQPAACSTPPLGQHLLVYATARPAAAAPCPSLTSELGVASQTGPETAGPQ